MSGGCLEVGGRHLAYDDCGQGRALLLIHGFPLCRRMWLPQLQPVAEAGFRVIAPDLRGFGESEPSAPPCSLEDYADDLVALLDHLGIERAVVAGMSMGGYILLNLLDRHPGRVSAAAFLFTRAGADDEAGKARRSQLAGEVAAGNRQALEDAFGPILFAEPTRERKPELVREVGGWIRQASTDGVVGALMAMRDRKDYTQTLGNIAVPCLVAGAELDRAVPPQNAAILAEGLADATSCLIPEAGHMANMEQPDLLNSHLLDFLRRLS